MNRIPTPKTIPSTRGLRRRIIERTQARIDAAKARGDYREAELLTLSICDYAAYRRELAKESAAAVAAIPLGER